MMMSRKQRGVVTLLVTSVLFSWSFGGDVRHVSQCFPSN